MYSFKKKNSNRKKKRRNYLRRSYKKRTTNTKKKSRKYSNKKRTRRRKMHRIRRNIRGGSSPRFTTRSLEGEEHQRQLEEERMRGSEEERQHRLEEEEHQRQLEEEEHQHRLEEERVRISAEREEMKKIKNTNCARIQGRIEPSGLWDQVRQCDLMSLKGKKVRVNSLSERCITNKSSETSRDEHGVARYPYPINNYHLEHCELVPANEEERTLGSCIVTLAGWEIDAKCKYIEPKIPPGYHWIGIVTNWEKDRMGAIKIAVQFRKGGLSYLFFMEDLLIDVCDISTKNQYHFVDDNIPVAALMAEAVPGTLKCSQCGAAKDKGSYSQNQLSKAGQRRCKTCVETAHIKLK